MTYRVETVWRNKANNTRSLYFKVINSFNKAGPVAPSV